MKVNRVLILAIFILFAIGCYGKKMNSIETLNCNLNSQSIHYQICNKYNFEKYALLIM